jgi:hypothetical protein
MLANGVDHSRDPVAGKKRPHRIVDEDDIDGIRKDVERSRHRLLSRASAGDDLECLVDAFMAQRICEPFDRVRVNGHNQ